jgi:hypothetical protein
MEWVSHDEGTPSIDCHFIYGFQVSTNGVQQLQNTRTSFPKLQFAYIHLLIQYTQNIYVLNQSNADNSFQISSDYPIDLERLSL